MIDVDPSTLTHAERERDRRIENMLDADARPVGTLFVLTQCFDGKTWTIEILERETMARRLEEHSRNPRFPKSDRDLVARDARWIRSLPKHKCGEIITWMDPKLGLCRRRGTIERAGRRR